MKVNELIEILKEKNQDAVVVCGNSVIKEVKNLNDETLLSESGGLHEFVFLSYDEE